MSIVEQVCLRPLLRADSSALYRWINDRELVISSSAYAPISEVEHESWFEHVTTNRSGVIFGIEVSGVLIGTCQLCDINRIHGTAELRIRIGEAEARGRGYGSTAVRKLLDYAFADLNLRRVWLHAFASNAAALRVYGSVGFRHEGLLRQAAYVNGTYVDVVVMGLLRDEFDAADDRRDPSV